jgi:hypothetical protein
VLVHGAEVVLLLLQNELLEGTTRQASRVWSRHLEPALQRAHVLVVTEAICGTESRVVRPCCRGWGTCLLLGLERAHRVEPIRLLCGSAVVRHVLEVVKFVCLVRILSHVT